MHICGAAASRGGRRSAFENWGERTIDIASRLVDDRDVNYRSVILDDELVAVVEGPFDDRLAPKAKGDLTRALAGGVKRIVVDLCDCPRVDDAGIAVLAEAGVALVDRGGALYLALDTEVFIEIDDEAVVRTVFDR